MRAPHPWTPDLTHQPSRDDLVVVIATSPAAQEDLTWVRCQPYDYAIMTKDESRHSMHNLRMNRGHEASAYLQFILLHWDHLPERMVFTHGHQHSWHVAVRVLLTGPTDMGADLHFEVLAAFAAALWGVGPPV